MMQGAYAQQGGWQELERLGSQLSKEINCPVRYPAYNKNMFGCKCGVTFPIYIVKSGDWDKVREIHKNRR